PRWTNPFLVPDSPSLRERRRAAFRLTVGAANLSRPAFFALRGPAPAVVDYRRQAKQWMSGRRRNMGQVQAELLDEDGVYYPETDEETVGETDFHMLALIWLRQGLEDFLALIPTIYVASDLFLYFVRGDPTRVRSPDVMVVKGVARRRR